MEKTQLNMLVNAVISVYLKAQQNAMFPDKTFTEQFLDSCIYF